MHDKIVRNLGTGIGIIALIIIIISCVLVSQIIKSNIADRTYEIGVLKSLGAERSEIFKMFVFENFIIGLICSLSAIIILTALSLAGMSSWATIDGISFYCLEWWHMVVILAVGLIITILSGLNKIRKASNMSVTDAIRTKNI